MYSTPWSWLVVAAAVLPSCSDDEHDHGQPTKHTTSSPMCQAIMDACHPLDVGQGPIHDCHDVATSANETTCTARRDACLATCGVDAGP